MALGCWFPLRALCICLVSQSQHHYASSPPLLFRVCEHQVDFSLSTLLLCSLGWETGSERGNPLFPKQKGKRILLQSGAHCKPISVPPGSSSRVYYNLVPFPPPPPPKSYLYYIADEYCCCSWVLLKGEPCGFLWPPNHPCVSKTSRTLWGWVTAKMCWLFFAQIWLDSLSKT